MTESSVAPAPPAAREPAAAVEARGLVKTYSSRTGTVEAGRGVDLHVEAGEVFGFLGPNGAGKSTMVRMLTTLLSFMSGEAHVAESTSRANRTRCVGAPMSAANR